MSGGRKPGIICGSDVGPKWIDSGTLSRTRSGGGGPLGMVAAMFMGASPETPLTDDPTDPRNIQVIIKDNIGYIARTPFGRKPKGREVVELLKTLNQSFNITYGDTLEDSRGDWDGTTIRMDDACRYNRWKTIVEMVHEGSHALWRKQHAKSTDGGINLNLNKEIVDEELAAQENQLEMYLYLRRHERTCPVDEGLEIRLRRQARGQLRKAIEERFGISQE